MDSVGFRVSCCLLLFCFVFDSSWAANKTKESAKGVESLLIMFPEWSKLDVVDYLRSGAVILAFLAALFMDFKKGNPQFWKSFEIFSLLALGFASYFFPDSFLGYITSGKLDLCHVFLLQTIGAVCVGHAVCHHVSSNDNGVRFSQLMTRFLGLTSIMLVMLYAQYKSRTAKKEATQKLSEQHMSFLFLLMKTWWVGTAIRLFRFENVGRRGSYVAAGMTGRNVHLFIFALVAFVGGIFHFVFPDMFFSRVGLDGFKADGIHYYLMRIMGLLSISFAMHAFNVLMLDQNNDGDRKAVFSGTLVVNMLGLPLLALYQWKHSMMDIRCGWCLGLVLALIIANNICGYCNCKCLCNPLAWIKKRK